MGYTRCWFHKSNSAKATSSVLRPGRHDASHAGVCDQLTHVLVGMNDDAEIHPIGRRVSIGDADFTLQVVGFCGPRGCRQFAWQPALDLFFSQSA